ncbi:ATP-dependent RecD-like DNA helicase [Saccharicrinis sp. FJH54]|uniref:ATP-dependent DNA helicase n=1 Tax=Saccharicrinis sp. FJH54 TaxID=3344665 RepID=UPI0035D3FCF8
MLENHFKAIFTSSLRFEPTGEQLELIDMLTNFYLSDNVFSLFLLKGYAGTGKTTVISAFIKTLSQLQQSFVLLAPTGRAAKVLSQMSGFPAYTIHKQIYRQKNPGVDPDSLGAGSFSLDFNKSKDTVFIVDEASMITNKGDELNLFGSGDLLDELIKYVYEGARCRIIFIGDLAQLPPVGTILSPALDPGMLRGYGLDVLEFTLREVLRQTSDSGILSMATRIRKQLADKNFSSIPKFSVNGRDVISISGEYLSEQVSASYDSVGVENVIIITRSNKRANLFNQGIRSTVLYREEEIVTGDYLMVVKNSYHWTEKIKELDFIANGDMAEIVSIRGITDLYDQRFAEVTLRFPDYNNYELDVTINTGSIMHDGPSLSSSEMQELYFKILEDYPDVKSKKETVKTMREDPFYNALQVKYGYAVTCHKSQGGQWKHVYLDLGYITDEMVDLEFLRWLYTAVTRATDKLYLVNFPAAILEYTDDSV